MKEILVGPFEIKKQPERLTRLDVVEWRAAGVEEKRLHSGQAGIGKNIALDEAVFDRRLIVIFRGPGAGGELLAKIIFAGEKRLERNRAVAVVVDLDGIEIEPPPGDRKVLRPVVSNALVNKGAAGIYPREPVRAGAEQRGRSEEHTSELKSRENLVCRLLRE